MGSLCVFHFYPQMKGEFADADYNDGGSIDEVEMVSAASSGWFDGDGRCV